MVQVDDEPFVGTWRDREEMVDSVAWVRRLRSREWARGNAVSRAPRRACDIISPRRPV
jgi:hypothetical protein